MMAFIVYIFVINHLKKNGLVYVRKSSEKRTHQAAAVAHHPKFKISAIVGWEGQTK